MKRLCLSFLLFCSVSLGYAQKNDSVSINIIQPDVYIVKNDWSQQINFDLNIGNRKSESINLKRIELYVYDRNEKLVCFKALRDGPIAPSIGTIPARQISGNENVTIFNPFTVFNPYIDLYRLKYLLSFKGDSGKNFTIGIDVQPQLYEGRVELSVPLKGRLFVLDGSDLYSNHRRFDINNPLVRDLLNARTNPEMFAIDFSVIDGQGEAYSGDRENNANYYIYGETVYAPAGGKVVKTKNGYEDNKPGRLAFKMQDAKKDKNLFPGNCVVIDHLTGEYSFLVHLQKESVLVKEGDMVKKGQPIGRVGNSGSSMYPHLHYQLGDRPDYLNSNGLPINFHNYSLIAGEKLIEIEKGYISAGDIIESK